MNLGISADVHAAVHSAAARFVMILCMQLCFATDSDLYCCAAVMAAGLGLLRPEGRSLKDQRIAGPKPSFRTHARSQDAQDHRGSLNHKTLQDSAGSQEPPVDEPARPLDLIDEQGSLLNRSRAAALQDRRALYSCTASRTRRSSRVLI